MFRAGFFSIAMVCLLAMVWVMVPYAVVFAQYNNPESAIYDAPRDRYIISNTGDGTLTQVASDGTTSTWQTGLEAPKGMAIVGDTLYVADINRIIGINLTLDLPCIDHEIINSQGLNDIAADGEYLYITDFLENAVFKMDAETREVTSLVTNGLSSPNGLLYDEDNNRLLLCSFIGDSPIQSIDPSDGTLATVTTTDLSNLDGLAMDGEGNVYVSSWYSDAVHKFDSDTWTDEIASSWHYDPADIWFDIENNHLIVPNYSNDTVDFIYIGPQPRINIPAGNNYYFGQVELYHTANYELVIENVGDSTLVVRSIDYDDPFLVFFVEEFDSLIIEPSESDSVTIAFTPTEEYLFMTTLEIMSNDTYTPQCLFVISGNGSQSNVETGDVVPSGFSVSEAWPNPFNPLTNIEIGLNKSTFVTVTVYDILGRETAMLVQGEFTAGRHLIRFDTENLHSGTYYFKINASDENEVIRRAMLIK